MPEAASSPDYQLSAICRRDHEARTKLAAHFNLPDAACFEDWRQMLDAVDIQIHLVVLAAFHARAFNHLFHVKNRYLSRNISAV